MLLLTNYITKPYLEGIDYAKTKRGVTFPINVLLQQAITDFDKGEIKKIVVKHGNNVLDHICLVTGWCPSHHVGGNRTITPIQARADQLANH